MFSPIKTTALLLMTLATVGCASTPPGVKQFKGTPAPIFAVEAPATAAVNTDVTAKAWVLTEHHAGGGGDIVLWPSTFKATVDEASMTVRVTGQVLDEETGSGPVATIPSVFFLVPQDVTFKVSKAGTYTIEVPADHFKATLPGYNTTTPAGATAPSPAQKRTITIQ